MSIFFNDGDSESIRFTSGKVPTTYPATFMCWGKTDDNTQSQYALGAGETSVAPDFASLLYRGVTSDIVEAFHHHYGGSGPANGASTNALTDNKWHLLSGCFTEAAGTVTATGWLDGDDANKGSEASSTVNLWTSNDEIWLSGDNGSTPTQFWSGYLAEAAIWLGVALSSFEMRLLADGVRPNEIRPDKLIFYAPMINDFRDVLNPRRTSIVAGTPVVVSSEHPKMKALYESRFLSAALMESLADPGAGGTDISPYYFQHLQGAA